MKKNLLPLVLLPLFSSAAYSQSATVVRDSTVTVAEDRYKVETNRFFDNWFFSLGAGAQMMLSDHNRQMDFGDAISPVYEVNLGKWFTPGIGTRIGVNGLKVKGVTQNGAYSTGQRYDGKPWDGYWLYNQEIEYFHVHGDVLFNLTNIFGGYRESRIFEISPYVGLGWLQATNGPEEKEISANVGLYNTFRLGRAFQLLVDVRGAAVHDRFDGEEGDARLDGLLTATAGIVYKFNKRNWEQPRHVKVVERYDDAAQRLALQKQIDRLLADNELLKKQLAEAKSNTVTEVKVERDVLVAPILVTFPIDTWKVSNEARVNLGFFAEVVKKGGPNVKYTITGYADKYTGSPKRNEKLSRERANVIYDVLVNEFGVNPDQLIKRYEGGVDNMYYNDPRLSRAVIVIAE